MNFIAALLSLWPTLLMLGVACTLVWLSDM